MAKTPEEIRARDRERKARKRQALRRDPEKWQAELGKVREASRRYRMGCTTPYLWTRFQQHLPVPAEGGSYVYLSERDHACLGLLTMAGTA
uniref:Uncharacterized protein n=1 Tax=Mycena chlorophos TaxID=658473 RepID=A0ABQ0KVH7_MYCCL|nr:predicted protein [Mycena chlorophos]